MAPIIFYIIGGCQAPLVKPLQVVGALWRQNYIMGPKKRSIGTNPYIRAGRIVVAKDLAEIRVKRPLGLHGFDTWCTITMF